MFYKNINVLKMFSDFHFYIYFTTHAKTISLQISTLTVIRLTWNKKVISVIERLTILLIYFCLIVSQANRGITSAGLTSTGGGGQTSAK